ncbi:hypothetical protein B0H11DRAFT_2109120 [Mycena galericulata]|nr:hypothetical protein B0H11DRAFT_2109120 [Mycena galericulata]
MPRVRLLAFIKRIDTIPFEEFDKHWGTHHGALFASLSAVKEGIVKYKQVHVVLGLNTVLTGVGLPVAAYDGIAEFEADTLEQILGLFGSEEYRTKVMPNEAKFFDRTAVQVMAGTEISEFKGE